ncbi:MAG TPA: ribosome maturation factor RimM [Alphaproteobacteria bacterium]|nr:ribosome maturation factor RimM [Alphaproteobacteria bacterium]
MSEKQKILVGKIVAAQGLRGEVRIQTFTENPSDFQNLKIENINLKFIRAAGNDIAICKIDNVNDRTSAEALRGTELFINRDSLRALKAGEYYQSDLIGMVVEKNKDKIGTVAAIQNFGAGDILELDNGEMVSFSGADVDLKNKTIYVK